MCKACELALSRKDEAAGVMKLTCGQAEAVLAMSSLVVAIMLEHPELERVYDAVANQIDKGLYSLKDLQLIGKMAGALNDNPLPNHR